MLNGLSFKFWVTVICNKNQGVVNWDISYVNYKIDFDSMIGGRGWCY
jgi:hypothetical protein